MAPPQAYGKTIGLAHALVQLAQQGNKVTIACANEQSKQNIIDRMKLLGADLLEDGTNGISFRVSDNKQLDEETNQ